MSKEPWHLDKKVPIALILMILGQTFAFVAFISKMDSRINALENQAVAFTRWKDGTQEKLDMINVTLGRVDERMRSQSDMLTEIKDFLKRR